MTKRALQAAESLESKGISAEIVDLRSISPLDEDAILGSVIKTGRALVLSEAVIAGSSANDVAAIIAERAFSNLKTGVRRLAPPAIPTPFARELEKQYLPDVSDIVEAAASMQ